MGLPPASKKKTKKEGGTMDNQTGKAAEQTQQAQTAGMRISAIDACNALDFALLDNADKREIYPTGFSGLDAELSDTNGAQGGFLPEGLYCVGAISSIGKTAFVLQIADQIASLGIPVLYATLEMTARELVARSISRYTAIMATNDRMKKTEIGIRSRNRWNRYEPEEKDMIFQARMEYLDKGGGKNVSFLEQSPGYRIGVYGIREAAKKYQEERQGEPPVVFVDYLQLLAPEDVRATDKQNMDFAISALKSLAMELSAPVVCISSFNRSSYKKSVSLEAFKESGSIEYTADCILGLQFVRENDKEWTEKELSERQQEDPRKIEAVILKNRHGRVGGKVCFEYFPRWNYLREGHKYSPEDSSPSKFKYPVK